MPQDSGPASLRTMRPTPPEALAWAEARAARSMAEDPGPKPGAPPAGRPVQRRPADLIVPLVTLLGLAERPGKVQGFGLLDPGLARKLTAGAAASPRAEVCVTVTSPEGYAIGHGCARPEHGST